MKKRDKGKIRDQLLEEREKAAGTLHIDIEPASVSGDEADISSGIEQQDMMLKINERSMKRIKDIDDAVARLEHDDTFGDCDSCGEEIEVKRLLALPTVRTCIDCAQAEEKANRYK